jgi:CBS domain containing-hemolysin-like protein
MTVWQLLAGLASILTNALFVGGEFGLVSVRRSQIEPRAEAGERRARTVVWGLEHVSALLATAQLGVTASSLVLGAVAEPAASRLLEPALHGIGFSSGAIHTIAFVIALAVATYLHMLIGEMVPKNLALARPERAALALVPSLVALTRALSPVISVINALANGVLRILGVRLSDEVLSTFTEDELAQLVRDSSEAHLLPERETELAQEVLDLDTRPVREVARPLADIVKVGADVTPPQLEELAARTGFSRFPICRDAELLGYLHVKDVIGAAVDRPFPRAVIRPVARVDAQTPLDDVLDAMRRSGTHLAAVTGPDDETIGLASMQDVLTGLVGSEPREPERGT